MSTWLSNQCIGLNQEGYGALLSEATFTSTRVGVCSKIILERGLMRVPIALCPLGSNDN
jgi:hypothetical protein